MSDIYREGRGGAEGEEEGPQVSGHLPPEVASYLAGAELLAVSGTRRRVLAEIRSAFARVAELEAKLVDAQRAAAHLPELEEAVDSVLDALQGAVAAHARGFDEGLEAAAKHVEERVGTSVGYGLKVVSSAEVAGELRAKKVGA